MSEQNAVFEVDPQTFQTEVIERSQGQAVVLLFWADQVPESVDARRTLEAQANASQGKMALALVDVARDQALAQHLRVQALPSIRVVQGGQLSEQLDGPQTQASLIALCDRLTLSSGEVLQAQLAEILEAGDLDTALALLQQAINEEPNNTGFRVELVDVLVRKGELADARQLLDSLPADADGIARPRTRLELLEEAAALAPADQLAAAATAEPPDLAARYDYCIALAAAGELEPALEAALDILCTDRKFRDDIGRLTMLRLFELLPKGSELASGFRRRMFNFMH